MQSKEHWEHVYSTKAIDDVSWFQTHASRSLHLIHSTGISHDASIIDVGGGVSPLVSDLLAEGYRNITVLDISAAALNSAKLQLGKDAEIVEWLEADITKVDLPSHAYDVWHDRAVFHFLTRPEDRKAYIKSVLHAVKPGGHIIIATFAQDGPLQCSGLPVKRYSAQELQKEFGSAFYLVSQESELHHTPFDTTQQFTYCHFRKLAL